MFRDLLEYLIRVKNGQSDIDHLWIVHIVKFMAMFNLWFDTDDWAKSKWTTKLLNFIIITFMFLLWPLIIIRICMDFDELPIHRVTEGISLSFGGIMTLLSCIRSAIQRDTLTKVVRKLDERYLAVPKDSPRLQKWWEEERKNYVLEGYVLLIALGVGCSVGTLQILIMLSTGGLFYATAIPLSEESYSWQWWIQMLYQSWNPIYSAIYYSLKEMLWLGIYYHLSVLYKVQADTIMEVCQDDDYNPDEEYKKLRGALQEMGRLEEIANKINDFTSPYVFAIGLVTFAMLSISAITVLLQSGDGWFNAIAQSIAFPVYVALICGTWAFMGDFFSDSVEAVDQALYNCNWTVAPLRVKKLLLLYKIRMSKPTFIKGGPYFVMNWDMFGVILKNSYYVLTILADVLL